MLFHPVPLILTINISTVALVITCSLYQVNELSQKAPFAGY